MHSGQILAEVLSHLISIGIYIPNHYRKYFGSRPYKTRHSGASLAQITRRSAGPRPKKFEQGQEKIRRRSDQGAEKVLICSKDGQNYR
ncbi:hypothetical protein [Sphingobacterium cellulitidis]|uniref:hypothetical protein n=1 Tax=Sphingobacterium cellulitidis TaxID=1768011 RepID=UPI0015F7EF9F|nr:hypothetical protein [Sphingobacterium soli]MBA8987871.1 hypothetical protein [Sphingobacterium soli]